MDYVTYPSTQKKAYEIGAVSFLLVEFLIQLNIISVVWISYDWDPLPVCKLNHWELQLIKINRGYTNNQ